MKSVGSECLIIDLSLESTAGHIYKINKFVVEATEKKKIVMNSRENLKEFL